jgi:hypothetical protein
MSDELTLSLAKRLNQLFIGLDRAHIVFTKSAKEVDGVKVEGVYKSVAKAPTIDTWLNHIEGRISCGIIPITDSGNVHFSAIDIDRYPLDLKALDQKVIDLSLPLFVMSSKSGGAHVYAFFSEPVPAVIARKKMLEIAAVLGYPGVEVFPKQVKLASVKDMGNGINMPYFNHEDPKRYCVMASVDHNLTLEEFVTRAEDCRMTAAELNNLDLVKHGSIDFNDGPPCLQHIAKEGVPSGTRNVVLFNMGVYCRNKYGDDWQTELDICNSNFCSPPVSTSEVLAIHKSAKRKEYAYQCKQFPLNSACTREVCLTRKYGVNNGNSERAGASVELSKIVKLLTTPPLWIVEVDGGIRIECSTDELMDQRKFQRLVLEQTNKIIGLVKAHEWHHQVSTLMNNVEEIPAPDDSDPSNRLMYQLTNFLTSVIGETREELVLGKPVLDSGVFYFRMPDFSKYMLQQRCTEFTNVGKMYSMLRQHGIESKKLRFQGIPVHVWCVQEDVISRPDKVDVPVPDMKEGDF